MNDTCWKCEERESVIKVRSIEFQQGDYAEMVPACLACTRKCENCSERFFKSEMQHQSVSAVSSCQPCELQYWIDEGHGTQAIREELDRWTVREVANV
jgi:hypothetical protein